MLTRRDGVGVPETMARPDPGEERRLGAAHPARLDQAARGVAQLG